MADTMAHQYAQQGNLDNLKEHLQNNPNDINALDMVMNALLLELSLIKIIIICINIDSMEILRCTRPSII